MSLDYPLPPSKRARDDGTEGSGGGRLIVSPLRPRKAGTVRTKDQGVPTVQLHWLVSGIVCGGNRMVNGRECVH